MDASKRNGARALSSAAIAATAAGLFLSGITPVIAADAREAKVQCAGVNACKGKSACSSARNGCKGQNECKGKGWLSMTEKECMAKGGKAEKG